MRRIARGVVAVCVVAGFAAASIAARGSSPPANCAAGAMSASFTPTPLGQHGAFAMFALIVRNTGGAACRVPRAPRLTLLGNDSRPMPTTVVRRGQAVGTIDLLPRQFAQATATVRIIEGPGDPRNCLPWPTDLAVHFSGQQLLAAMRPYPICQHGRIVIGPLEPVAVAPDCTVRALSVRYYALGDAKADDGSDEYSIMLTNHGAACTLEGPPRLRLLGVGGTPLPTREDTGGLPAVPLVIDADGRASSLATMFFEKMPGSHGPAYCGARAESVRVSPLDVPGSITAPLQPPLKPCYHGTIGDIGFVHGQPFE